MHKPNTRTLNNHFFSGWSQLIWLLLNSIGFQFRMANDSFPCAFNQKQQMANETHWFTTKTKTEKNWHLEWNKSALKSRKRHIFFLHSVCFCRADSKRTNRTLCDIKFRAALILHTGKTHGHVQISTRIHRMSSGLRIAVDFSAPMSQY